MGRERVKGRVYGPESVHKRRRGGNGGSASTAAARAEGSGRRGPCGPAVGAPEGGAGSRAAASGAGSKGRGAAGAAPAEARGREASADTAPLLPLGGTAAEDSVWEGFTSPATVFEMPGSLFGAGRSSRRWKSREGKP